MNPLVATWRYIALAKAPRPQLSLSNEYDNLRYSILTVLDQLASNRLQNLERGMSRRVMTPWSGSTAARSLQTTEHGLRRRLGGHTYPIFFQQRRCEVFAVARCPKAHRGDECLAGRFLKTGKETEMDQHRFVCLQSTEEVGISRGICIEWDEVY